MPRLRPLQIELSAGPKHAKLEGRVRQSTPHRERDGSGPERAHGDARAAPRRSAGITAALTRCGTQPRRGREHGDPPTGGARDRRRPPRRPTLNRYHLIPSVRGDLLKRLGRHHEARAEEARAEYDKAAKLTTNPRKQAALLERAATCATQP
jgi:hypothetical protein